ncbi:MAG: HPr family phosphocarrier protein [Clostridiales bacterium]|nr:HPr family phosphocarrier protein [Clostridiales bacterium]
MKTMKIKLATVEEAKDFVNAAARCDFDVNVSYNHVIIDAKSILGVFSMDLRQVLTVSMNGDDETFEDYLRTLAPVSEMKRIA